MHAHDIGSEVFHFLKIFGHRGPFGLPVIFEEATAIVVIVVEAPRLKGTAGRVQDKAALVGGDADGLEGRRFGGGESEGEAEDDQRSNETNQRCDAPDTRPGGAARRTGDMGRVARLEIHRGQLSGMSRGRANPA